MKNKTVIALALAGLIFGASCSSNNNLSITGGIDSLDETCDDVKNKPHQFGGWYCPDNLHGFPAIDIANWKNVPVVNGRMPTQEEARNGTSLIYVDPAEYPNAKPLNMKMPRLATFYNESARREDIVIVIQAFNVSEDSIVGFRYLNGGNGSARLNEVKFLSDSEIQKMPDSRFVAVEVEINKPQDVIWEVLTKTDYLEKLQPIFNKDKKLKSAWRESTNVNYHYYNAGNTTASVGGKVFGCYYVQNDYDQGQFTEKFLLLENQETKITQLVITCGPYTADFENQKIALTEWAQKVKALSEQ